MIGAVRYFIHLFLLLAVPASAQEDQQEKPRGEKVVVVTASPLNPKDVFDTPYSAEVVTSDDIRGRRQSRTMPATLRETPNISVQETGPSQGSPIIRGMTSYHTALLIDGIRLNHSGMRSGPNQYWGTVDAFLIDRLEVVYGPSSVLYGSDSLGGTVNIHTIRPQFEEETAVHTRSNVRYSSAERSTIIREEVRGNSGDLGWVVGGTYKDFNSMAGGKRVSEMRNTGYDEYDADLKLVYRLSEDSELVFAAQHHRLDDGNRWHSTLDNPGWHGTSPGSDIFRGFDQERNLYYVQYEQETEGGGIDKLKASLSWHRQAEKTNRQRTATRREVREFAINTPALWVQAGKETEAGFFTAGIDIYHDIVTSSGHDWNPGLIPITRGIIADDATYTTIGLFLQDEFSIGNLDVTPGIRFSRISVDADEVDPVPGGSVIVDEIDESWSAVTGSLRLLHYVNENWNVLGGWGMGFHAPSLHDLTSTDLVLSGSLEVPSPDIDPEYAHTLDLGFRTRYEGWEVSVVGYYTFLRDFLRRVSVGDTNGDFVDDFGRDNVSDGWIYGFEIQARADIADEVSAHFAWGYSKGRSDRVGGGDEPISKMNPPRAVLSLRYEPESTPLWVEGVIIAADGQDHQSAADKADTERQPPGGTPGYTVYHLRAGYEVNENVNVSLSVENFTNKDYRIHGSGQNMPGTNAILGIDISF